MMAMTVNHFVPDDGKMGETRQSQEIITADLTGTAASITDTTTYAVTDQDGLTSIVTLTDGSGEAWDGVAQTVTFSGATTTALQVAAQMNDQLAGCSVVVTGGQVVITSDLTGSGITLAVAAGTGDLTWDTPVAGTGQSATWPKGTLLARNTSTTKLSAYADGGSNGLDEPVAVLPYEITFAASGDRTESVLISGPYNKSNITKLDDATAIGVLVWDKLIKNSDIVPVAARDLSAYDNE